METKGGEVHFISMLRRRYTWKLILGFTFHLCPFEICSDMCLPAKCGAARSVSRDIPFVSFPCAEEKYTTLAPLAVPALQQQHAMVIIGGNLEITIL